MGARESLTPSADARWTVTLELAKNEGNSEDGMIFAGKGSEPPPLNNEG